MSTPLRLPLVALLVVTSGLGGYWLGGANSNAGQSGHSQTERTNVAIEHSGSAQGTTMESQFGEDSRKSWTRDRIAHAVTAICRESDAFSAILPLLRFVDRLTLEDMPAAMLVAEEVGRGEETEKMFAMAVVMRWAELDPAGAAKQLDLSSNVGPFIEARDVLLPAWARRDPASAIAWAKGLKATHEQESALGTIFETIAMRNVAEATQLARANAPNLVPENGLPPWAIKSLCARPGADSAQSCIDANDVGGLQSVLSNWALKDAPAALAWVRELSDPKLKSAALGAVVTQLASKDPKTAIDALADVSSERLNIVSSAIVESWPKEEIDTLKMRILQMPDGDVNAEMAEAFGRRMGLPDINSDGRWIEGLPAGQMRDHATKAYLTFSHESPEKTIQLGLTISDRSIRFNAVRDVARKWFYGDPSAAYNWLSNSDQITEEERQAIWSNR